MEIRTILAEIDQEIARLQRARTLLAGDTESKSKGPGRKKKSANLVLAAKAEPKKRKLTPEGRKRIAEAMKRRWAERKKAAPKPSK